jgi:hypothetical protein
LFLAVHPRPARSDVWTIFSLLVLCVVSMLLAGLREHRLRSRLGPDAEAFIAAVHVPELPWKRAIDKSSKTA